MEPPLVAVVVVAVLGLQVVVSMIVVLLVVGPVGVGLVVVDLAGIGLVSAEADRAEQLVVWPEAGICYQTGQIEEQLQLVSVDQLGAGEELPTGPVGLVSVLELHHRKQ